MHWSTTLEWLVFVITIAFWAVRRNQSMSESLRSFSTSWHPFDSKGQAQWKQTLHTSDQPFLISSDMEIDPPKPSQSQLVWIVFPSTALHSNYQLTAQLPTKPPPSHGSRNKRRPWLQWTKALNSWTWVPKSFTLHNVAEVVRLGIFCSDLFDHKQAT